MLARFRVKPEDKVSNYLNRTKISEKSIITKSRFCMPKQPRNEGKEATENCKGLMKSKF